MLPKPSVDQMLIKARSHLKRNEISDAKKLYQDVLISFPKNKSAREGLATLVNRQKNKNSQMVLFLNLY